MKNNLSTCIFFPKETSQRAENPFSLRPERPLKLLRKWFEMLQVPNVPTSFHPQFQLARHDEKMVPFLHSSFLQLGFPVISSHGSHFAPALGTSFNSYHQRRPSNFLAISQLIPILCCQRSPHWSIFSLGCSNPVSRSHQSLKYQPVPVVILLKPFQYLSTVFRINFPNPNWGLEERPSITSPLLLHHSIYSCPFLVRYDLGTSVPFSSSFVYIMSPCWLGSPSMFYSFAGELIKQEVTKYTCLHVDV